MKKVYQYEVGTGAAMYVFSCEATSNKEGLAKVHALANVTQHTRIVLMDSQEGTLEDYLGEESMKRLKRGNKRIVSELSVYARGKEEKKEERARKYAAEHS